MKKLILTIFIIGSSFLANCASLNQETKSEINKEDYEQYLKTATENLWKKILLDYELEEEEYFSPYHESSCILIPRNKLAKKFPDCFCKNTYEVIKISQDTIILEQKIPQRKNDIVLIPILIIGNNYTIPIEVEKYFYNYDVPATFDKEYFPIRFKAKIVNFLPSLENNQFIYDLKKLTDKITDLQVNAWATNDFFQEFLDEDIYIIRKRMEVGDIIAEVSPISEGSSLKIFHYRLVVASNDLYGRNGKFFLTLPDSRLIDFNVYDENLETDYYGEIRKHLNPLNITSADKAGKLLGVLKEGDFKKKIYEEYFKDIKKTLYE